MADQKNSSVGTNKSGGKVSDSRTNVPIHNGSNKSSPETRSNGGSHSAGPKSPGR